MADPNLQAHAAADLPECLSRREDGGVVITGHRVKFHLVAREYRQRGSVDDVLRAFPTLERSVVDEVVAFLDSGHAAELLADQERMAAEGATRVEPGPSLAELRERRRSETRTP